MNYRILFFVSGVLLAVGVFSLILSGGMFVVTGMSAPSNIGLWSLPWCAMGALASTVGGVIRELEKRIAELEERLAARDKTT